MTSPSASELAFSQVREDPLLDLEVIERVAARRGRPVRVLLIASGGCTAVSLLGEACVAEIHAVDMNPAQLHLTALRQQAALRLAPGEVRALLGEGDAGPRRALVQALRPSLPEAARAHWDARPHEIDAGVNRVGRFEELFRELSRALAGDAGWHASFQAVFERGKLARAFGEEAVAYSMDRSFADHFEDVFAAATARWAPEANYFLHQVLRDSYPAAGSAPPYLDDGFRARAARLGGDRLHLCAGRFDELLDELAPPGRFDVIQTSNISDWMPLPRLDGLLARVRARLAPGGAIVARRLNGDHSLAGMVARHFQVDRAGCDDLRARDRSFFYREVVAGWA